MVTVVENQATLTKISSSHVKNLKAVIWNNVREFLLQKSNLHSVMNELQKEILEKKKHYTFILNVQLNRELA